MDIIFHEKQQGSLCAQHCLNALLQGPYFTAVDLATIGHRFDEEERARMAEAGVSSEEYNRFLQEPSSNVDDSGYFSVQVISEALSVWGLELIPYNSSDPRAAVTRQCPINENAFICHYRDHWFSIRKLGSQWFNLNSILSGPELLSDTYLSLFLAQLQTDKYSIFIVVGDLPSCEADKVLSVAPLSPRHFRKAPTKKQEPEEDDEQLKAALAMSWKEMEEGDDQEALNKAILQSLQSSQQGQELPAAIAPEASISTVDEDLKRAISLSLSQDHGETSSSTAEASTSSAISDSVEFIRQRRLLRLGQSATSPNNP
ncbi:ataxin-3-like [Daphnia pulicaria]|uniref:ataxin-3-like n=1 Tax=Daphnia pulicaria TaxID=35523 RepID=UPI001EEA7758|nr:ataxin-3-like [Daphnia pulicaria]